MVGPTAPPACESVYRRCVFLALLLMSVAGGSAAAADVPTADSLRERIRSAAGTPPPTSHSVLTYEANGFHGRHETYRSGDDFREIVEEGPFTTQSGRFEKQAWHQNENGETVLDQPDPGAATKDTYTTSVRAIATPIIGYVIAELNLAGSGTREYVDSATWHVVRRERIRPIGTTTYAYDDFRTVTATRERGIGPCATAMRRTMPNTVSSAKHTTCARATSRSPRRVAGSSAFPPANNGLRSPCTRKAADFTSA